jgi:hypothetical protein
VNILLAAAREAKDKGLLPLFIDVFATLTVGFDVFMRLAKVFTDLDEDVTAVLWSVVFGDNLGRSTVRPFVNPAPLAFIFQIIAEQEAEIEPLFDFLLACLAEHSECTLLLSNSEFPGQLLDFLWRYRSVAPPPPFFEKVLTLFEVAARVAVNPKDLLALFRLCASLPGGVRPVFTQRIIRTLTTLFEMPSDTSPSFDLGDSGYIQLPSIPLDVFTQGFSLHVCLRLHARAEKIDGCLMNLSGQAGSVSIFYKEPLLTLVSDEGTESVAYSLGVPLRRGQWISMIFFIKDDALRLRIDGRSQQLNFRRPIVQTSCFSTFRILESIPCEVCSVLLHRHHVSDTIVKALESLPRFPVASFYASEASMFPRSAASLFGPEFRDGIYFLFHAHVTSGSSAIDLVGQFTAEVAGHVRPPLPRAIALLDNIGGASLLLPMFGQLEHPTLSPDGPVFLYDPKLLPGLFRMLSLIFENSLSQQISFALRKGCSVIAFLLNISGIQYLTEETAMEIAHLFSCVTHVPLATQMLQGLLFNCDLWIFLPVPVQIRF